MSYKVLLESTAERDIQHLARDILKRIDSKLEALARDPRPHGVTKLQGREGTGWRVRVGDYRILYTIDDDSKTVYVYRIRSRGNAYRL
ncbi:MAG: type II toxin-antitoxin system RelE/ParE family toxin [Armatimonadota bacterium]|nr:type II toxin-antitoxin system RelE/ParE family toxin [Armatimonadota bacterium]